MDPHRSSSRPSSAFEVRLFGPFTVLKDGHPLPQLRTRKGQSLFALLALRAGRGIERPWLAGTLWPESAEAQARYNLRRTLSDLRVALGAQADRLRSGGPPQTLTLDLQDATVDVLAFDEAIGRGDAASLQAAVALYGGPLLEGCLEEWVVPEREARERSLLHALEQLGCLASAERDWSAAEGYLRRAVTLDPLRETAQRALMQVLADAGTPAEALQCYRELRLLLARELQSEPAPETTALHRRIRADARRLLQPSPSRSPALRPPAVRGSIPRPRTAFLGREQEIEDVASRMQRARLLTLTGAGGVGKTRLAVRVAEHVEPDFDEGAWFVDLAPLADGDLVARAVAAVLGVRDEPKRTLVDTLCDYMATKRLLVILDNCEHLIAACAAVVETLLRRCSRLHVCITSRQALGIDGESVYRVASLSLPEPHRPGHEPHWDHIADSEAVRLFLARANESSPGFEMTARNAATVAEICTRLDGIPLAIELAAARLRVLSVEQIAGRLDDRFRLLTGGNRAALPRQQTLRATLDWSHDLLDTREQIFLRRLSCFTGGATLEAVESICSGDSIAPDDALDLIAALVDKSLAILHTEGDGAHHYDLLETIRQYGQEHLTQSGEAGEVKERHATFFLDFANGAEQHLAGPEQGVWLERLEAEHNNLRAALTLLIERDPARALALALALNPFWEARAHFVEGRRWLEWVSAANPGAPTMLRARAAAAAGRLAWYQDDYAAARAPLEESLRLFEAIGERRSVVAALGTLAQVAVTEGDYGRARALCEWALAEARALGDKQVLAGQLRDFGTVAGALFDIATCRVVAEEALVLCRELGDTRGVARALMDLGTADAYSGDPHRARGRLLESLALGRVTGDSWIICGAALGLGQAETTLGDFAAAHRHYAESLRLCRESNTNFSGPLLEVLAALAALEGLPVRASTLLGASEAFHEARRFSMLPYLQAGHDQAVAAARSALGPDAFATAWAEGRAMGLDQAVALALTRGDEAPSPRR